LTTCSRADAGAGFNYPFLTQKERDIETGLDYSLARYYSPVQGRFTSVDPLLGSAKPSQPQGWNRYSYTINNPLKYVDPTGLIWGYYTDNLGQGHYQWYGDRKTLDASGATVVTNFVYEANNGSWIRLNRESSKWEAYESRGQAIERTHGPLGDSSTVTDQAFSLALSDTGGRIVACVGARLLAGVMARTTMDFAGDGLAIARRGGAEAAEMELLRVINPGEKLADIVNDAKAFSFQTGNEHALVTLANGQRALVSGGEGGIRFGEGQIKRLFGHTHGYHYPAGGASAADRAAIQALGQRSSWVLEHGKLFKFGK
jgi:RHS repeat-associated protein